MENLEKVMNYRQSHRRCRTCKYAKEHRTFSYEWYCTAKNSAHIFDLKHTFFAGCLCGLYEPRTN